MQDRCHLLRLAKTSKDSPALHEHSCCTYSPFGGLITLMSQQSISIFIWPKSLGQFVLTGRCPEHVMALWSILDYGKPLQGTSPRSA